MDGCVGVHESTGPAAAMELGVGQTESPTKKNTVKSENPVAEMGFQPQLPSMGDKANSRDLSKTETFFDSQAWLESDSEDFFSVNGDPTPSHCSSPIHQKSFIGRTPRSETDDASSQIEMKKQLIELFRESFGDDHINGDLNLKGQQEDKPVIFDQPPKSPMRSPYGSVPKSVSSNERTPYGGCLPKKEKSSHSAQCCLPSLVRSLSFGERKKRSLNPAKANGW